MNRAALSVLLSIAAASTAPVAASAGEPEGRVLAAVWCSACHVVAPGQESAVEGVPTFAEIARTRDDAAIRGFLFEPHPPMPEFNLSERQVRELVAWVRAQAPDDPDPTADPEAVGDEQPPVGDEPPAQ